ncbi:ribonuclease P protein component [uncultured Bilophila sp.]|uniref:ribonuclease P protein component n=1 Tax=uncultured Bilophila sp. TaxID=529385 RepID=UPI00267032B5|nr:ribonuclease P protein component [uncultured Bilophila sp.]
MSCLTRPRRHRLLRRPDFTLCYDEGRRFYSKHFVVFVRFRASGDPWRVGMAVTKKIGTAVMRNRVKRVLRECFRLHQALLPPAVDLVIVPKRHLKPEQLDLAAATREFLPLIKEIGGYVVLRREQNACPDSSRGGIAAPGGLEPETVPGVKA